MKLHYANFPSESMDSGAGVVAFPEPLLRMPPNGTTVTDWRTIEVRLLAGSPRDYMPGTSGARLCSSRLREFLERRCEDREYIQWLPVVLHFEEGPPTEYFALHFAGFVDVLDRDRTVFVGKSDFPRKPAFQAEVVGAYPFFAIPGHFGFIWFVRDDLKKEIMDSSFTGFSFDAVPRIEDGEKLAEQGGRPNAA